MREQIQNSHTRKFVSFVIAHSKAVPSMLYLRIVKEFFRVLTLNKTLWWKREQPPHGTPPLMSGWTHCHVPPGLKQGKIHFCCV